MSRTPSAFVLKASTSSAVMDIPTASICSIGRFLSIKSIKTLSSLSFCDHIGRYSKSTMIFFISPSSKSIIAKSVFAPPISKPAIFISFLPIIYYFYLNEFLFNKQYKKIPYFSTLISKIPFSSFKKLTLPSYDTIFSRSSIVIFLSSKSISDLAILKSAIFCSPT